MEDKCLDGKNPTAVLKQSQKKIDVNVWTLHFNETL